MGWQRQDIALAYDEIRRNTTPAYRSPEQVALHLGHVVSEKVDIWALGVMLYKLAFFHTPFEDMRGRVDDSSILKGLGDRKVRVPRVPRRLDMVLPGDSKVSVPVRFWVVRLSTLESGADTLLSGVMPSLRWLPDAGDG